MVAGQGFGEKTLLRLNFSGLNRDISAKELGLRQHPPAAESRNQVDTQISFLVAQKSKEEVASTNMI